MIGIGVGHGRDEAQIAPAEPQHVLLLLTLRVGHHDHRAIAAGVGHQGDADADIAGGSFDDHPTRSQLAVPLGVLAHGERCPVLDRSAGIEELGLAIDVATGCLGCHAQLDQGSVADAFDESRPDVHDSCRVIFWPNRNRTLLHGKEKRIGDDSFLQIGTATIVIFLGGRRTANDLVPPPAEQALRRS